MREARRRADKAGHYRFALPKSVGGKDGGNLAMAIIREHLAAKGLGLHNDLQTEHSIVGNSVGVLLMMNYGTAAAEGGVGRGDARRAPRASPSASPSPTTAPTPPTWRPTPSATATSGRSTARRPGTPASTRPSTT